MGAVVTCKTLLGFLLAGILLAAANDEDVREPAIKRLRDHLFAKYNKRVRPVHNSRDATAVEIITYPIYILGMSEDHGKLAVDAHIAVKWDDEFLTWNPEEYDGIGHLVVDCDEIWMPDIAVWDRLSTFNHWNLVASHKKPRMHQLLHSNGTIYSWSPTTLTVMCDADKDDPDAHSCHFMIGCEASDGTNIDITSGAVNTVGMVIKNPQWELAKYSTTVMHQSYISLQYPFVMTTLTIKHGKTASDDKSTDDKDGQTTAKQDD